MIILWSQNLRDHQQATRLLGTHELDQQVQTPHGQSSQV